MLGVFRPRGDARGRRVAVAGRAEGGARGRRGHRSTNGHDPGGEPQRTRTAWREMHTHAGHARAATVAWDGPPTPGSAETSSASERVRDCALLARRPVLGRRVPARSWGKRQEEAEPVGPAFPQRGSRGDPRGRGGGLAAEGGRAGLASGRPGSWAARGRYRPSVRTRGARRTSTESRLRTGSPRGAAQSGRRETQARHPPPATRCRVDGVTATRRRRRRKGRALRASRRPDGQSRSQERGARGPPRTGAGEGAPSFPCRLRSHSINAPRQHRGRLGAPVTPAVTLVSPWSVTAKGPKPTNRY